MQTPVENRGAGPDRASRSQTVTIGMNKVLF
jgi:hypothetical protein